MTLPISYCPAAWDNIPPTGRGASACTDRGAVLGVYGESTATRPSRPFGTPKSARASQELPILAGVSGHEDGPRQLKAMPRYLYRIAM